MVRLTKNRILNASNGLPENRGGLNLPDIKRVLKNYGIPTSSNSSGKTLRQKLKLVVKEFSSPKRSHVGARKVTPEMIANPKLLHKVATSPASKGRKASPASKGRKASPAGKGRKASPAGKGRKASPAGKTVNVVVNLGIYNDVIDYDDNPYSVSSSERNALLKAMKPHVDSKRFKALINNFYGNKIGKYFRINGTTARANVPLSALPVDPSSTKPFDKFNSYHLDCEDNHLAIDDRIKAFMFKKEGNNVQITFPKVPHNNILPLKRDMRVGYLTLKLQGGWDD